MMSITFEYPQNVTGEAPHICTTLADLRPLAPLQVPSLYYSCSLINILLNVDEVNIVVAAVVVVVVAEEEVVVKVVV